jgi:sulfur relay (sulfurtransferase) complex TusBCD TusD component (DsrE family)
MALVFSAKQQEKGHPLTIFLNNDGVTLANTTIARFAEHQKIISDAISKGATIIICPMCMKYFGVKEADIVKGLTIGSPDITGAALFKDNTKTLSW